MKPKYYIYPNKVPKDDEKIIMRLPNSGGEIEVRYSIDFLNIPFSWLWRYA